jgi:hypothetical protein
MGQYKLHLAVVSTMYSTGSAFSADLRRMYPQSNLARFQARMTTTLLYLRVEAAVG